MRYAGSRWGSPEVEDSLKKEKRRMGALFFALVGLERADSLRLPSGWKSKKESVVDPPVHSCRAYFSELESKHVAYATISACAGRIRKVGRHQSFVTGKPLRVCIPFPSPAHKQKRRLSHQA